MVYVAGSHVCLDVLDTSPVISPYFYQHPRILLSSFSVPSSSFSVWHLIILYWYLKDPLIPHHPLLTWHMYIKDCSVCRLLSFERRYT